MTKFSGLPVSGQGCWSLFGVEQIAGQIFSLLHHRGTGLCREVTGRYLTLLSSGVQIMGEGGFGVQQDRGRRGDIYA